jgi:hypothetical protein
MLYAGERVITSDADYRALFGDDPTKVIHNGEPFYLSARPLAAGEREAANLIPFEDSGIQIYSRDDLIDLLRKQLADKARNSDFQTFPPRNQARTNWCWFNGPAGACTTQRVKQGLPFEELSAASGAGPFTHYRNVGGNEVPAIQWIEEHGLTTSAKWPNAANDSHYDTPEVQADRLNHKAGPWIELPDQNRFLALLSGLVDGYTGAIAIDRMSHVMEAADAVEISPGKLGYRPRNSWDDWGAKNDAGFSGYVVFAEGSGYGPDSGFLLEQVTASAA